VAPSGLGVYELGVLDKRVRAHSARVQQEIEDFRTVRVSDCGGTGWGDLLSESAPRLRKGVEYLDVWRIEKLE
jgi:hypothetical protein